MSDRTDRGIQTFRRLLWRRSPDSAHRLPGRPDPRNPGDRAAAHQGRHRHDLAAGRCVVGGLLVAPSVLERFSRGQFELARLYRVYVPFMLFEFLTLYLLNRRLVLHRDVPTIAALSLRIDRNQPADLRAVFAHELDGTGAGAGVRSPFGVFRLHHPLDAAARFLALDLHRPGRCGGTVRDGDAVSPPGFRRRTTCRIRLSTGPQRDAAGRRHIGRLGRRSIAASVRGQHCRCHRARPRHQSVRPARIARGGRAADGRRRRRRQRSPSRRRDVRRFPQFHRGGAGRGRRRRWSSASMALSRCWWISWIDMAAS